MMRFAVGAVAALAIGAGQPVLAADMQVKTSPYQTQPSSWTGFYAGMNVGYGFGSAATSLQPDNAESQRVFPPFNPLPPTLDLNGFIGGGQVGYNRQFSNLVAGIETDLSYAGLRKTDSATGAPFVGGMLTTTIESKLDWFGTLRARLGVLATSDFLLYGTGGFAYGGAGTSTAGSNTLSCATHVYCVSGSTSGVSFGWTVGGGLEYAIARDWTVKGEYLYMDLGNRSVTFSDPVRGGGTLTASTDFRAQIVRAGFNHRF